MRSGIATVCTGVMPPNMVLVETQERECVGVELSARWTRSILVSVRYSSSEVGTWADKARDAGSDPSVRGRRAFGLEEGYLQ